MSRPNVLLVSLDAVRADRLECYGYPRPTSPFLDELGRRSLVFERAWASSHWTLPSHVSMFTGLPVSAHGVGVGRSGSRRMTSLRWRVLPEILREVDYGTVGFTNCAYLSRDTGFDRGFDSLQWMERLFEPDHPVAMHRIAGRAWGRRLNAFYRDHVYRRGDHGGARTVRRFRAWLREGRDRRRPFFAFVHLMEAHAPYSVPARVRRRFRTQGDGSAEWVREHVNPWHHNSGTRPLDADRLRDLSDLYDASVRYVDELVGRLVEALDAARLLDDTVVLVTADHGEYLGEHGLIGHGGPWLHEPVVRVPLLVSGPGIPAARIDTPVSHVDLLPTVLEAVDARAPRLAMQPRGESLLEVAGGRPGDRHVVAEALTDVRPRLRELGLPVEDRLPAWSRAVLSGNLKLVADSVDAPRLYDLQADPRERHDLASTRAADIEARMALVHGLMEECVDDERGSGSDALSEPVRARLRALGYLE